MRPRRWYASPDPRPTLRRRGEVGLSTLLPAATEGDGELMRVKRPGCATQVAPSFRDPLRWVEPTSAARRSMQAQRARSCRHERSGP